MNHAEQIRIWFDDEGNYLTVTWGSKKGYYIDTDDDRVLVYIDTEGNVQGFQVEDINSIKDKSLLVTRSMEWWDQLDNRRGSRPRCVLLTDGNREEVAERLTDLIDSSDVVVSPSDKWMPCGKGFTQVAQLDKARHLVSSDNQQRLRDWWLDVRGGVNTPNWDIASTCTIVGKPGLLLVEAKAYGKELSEQDKCGSKNPANRERIGQAISEASDGLASATGRPWALSRDHHYRLSNRFAWSWKLASMGIPVVLVYLGFLGAKDIADRGELFHTPEDWEQAVGRYCQGTVDNGCWGEWLDIAGVPFFPLIRTYDQPFNP